MIKGKKRIVVLGLLFLAAVLLFISGLNDILQIMMEGKLNPFVINIISVVIVLFIVQLLFKFPPFDELNFFSKKKISNKKLKIQKKRKVRFWEKKFFRMFRIFLAILIIVLFGSMIIFNLIFFITKWQPHFILRVVITYLLFELVLRFTWFGKEFEEFYKSKFKKRK